MSLCSWKLQLNPVVLLHLLLLLLLFTDLSVTESKALFHQPNTTQGTVCTSGCNGDLLTKNANLEDSLKNISSVVEKNQSSPALFHLNSSLAETANNTNSTAVHRGSEEDDDVKEKITQQVQFSHSPSPINVTTINSNFLFTLATVSPTRQSTVGPEPPPNQQPASPDPHQPSQPELVPAAATTTTVLPIINRVFTTTGVPSTPSMRPTLPPPSTPTNTTPTATISDAQTTRSSSFRTMTPTVQSTSVTELTASKATATNNATAAMVAPATKVSVVEVAGSALTRQLVDTAALLAVLVFGLLFFLVTVALFIRQAYESYRTKDYTQVDYLINGMYTDSGV